MGKGLITDIQRDALNPEARASGLLRKAKVLATKLSITELLTWSDRELRGYSEKDTVPDYRIIHGQLKGWNPYRGWIPMMFGDQEMEGQIQNKTIYQPITELEDLLLRGSEKESNSDLLIIPMNGRQNLALSKSIGFETYFALHFDRSQLKGIIEAVRDNILQWSLRLEQEGISGDGLSFSVEEKQRAAEVVYNIGHVGIIGNVAQNMGQISGRDINITEESNESLLRLVSTIKSQNFAFPPEIQKSLGEAALELERSIKNDTNKTTLRSIIEKIKEICISASGNLASEGVLSIIRSIGM